MNGHYQFLFYYQMKVFMLDDSHLKLLKGKLKCDSKIKI